MLKNELNLKDEAELDKVESESDEKTSKYKKYYTNDYHPTPHEYVEGE